MYLLNMQEQYQNEKLSMSSIVNISASAKWPFPLINGQRTEDSKQLMQQKFTKTKETLDDFGDATF